MERLFDTDTEVANRNFEQVIKAVQNRDTDSLKTLFSVQVYPALMGVGYICGIRIASYMFAGAVFGWFVLIPAIVSFGG